MVNSLTNNHNDVIAKEREKGWVHTMPRYLLRLRKTSFLLMDRSSAMSVGSSKASLKAEATWHPVPPQKSLMDALSLKGSPLIIGAGSQA